MLSTPWSLPGVNEATSSMSDRTGRPSSTAARLGAESSSSLLGYEPSRLGGRLLDLEGRRHDWLRLELRGQLELERLRLLRRQLGEARVRTERRLLELQALGQGWLGRQICLRRAVQGGEGDRLHPVEVLGGMGRCPLELEFLLVHISNLRCER